MDPRNVALFRHVFKMRSMEPLLNEKFLCLEVAPNESSFRAK
jgi:hypothetical protein